MNALIFSINGKTVKDSLKSDYPPLKKLALTPIFVSHRDLFKSHMPFGQSPERKLPRSKNVGSLMNLKTKSQNRLYRNKNL